MILTSTTLARTICAVLFLAVAAVSVDIWWHGAIGRDGLFIPPHVVLYATVGMSVVLGLYGWRQTNDRLWRRIALTLLLIPVSAPFDDLWHRTFGIESASSPLIVWSPPHIALALAMVASFWMLLRILDRDGDTAGRRFFGALAWGGILTIAQLLTSPLHPMGPYAVLGTWGAVIEVAVFVALLQRGGTWLGSPGGAMSVALWAVVLYAMEFSTAQDSIAIAVPPHPHPPLWVVFLTILGPAAALDVLAHRSKFVRGFGAGLVYALMMYALAYVFIEPEFAIAWSARLLLIALSVAGAVIGIRWLARRESEQYQS